MFIKNSEAEKGKASSKTVHKKRSSSPVLKESDPLYGVLEENQVGWDPLSGRPIIAPEVLTEMRRYLLTVNGPERIIRVERIKNSLLDLAKDPSGQKSMLRLEPSPRVSMDIDKGKGRVFDFDIQRSAELENGKVVEGQKLLASAIRSGIAMTRKPTQSETQSEAYAANYKEIGFTFEDCPTVFSTCTPYASASWTSSKNVKPRKRPDKSRRKPKGKETQSFSKEEDKKKGTKRATRRKERQKKMSMVNITQVLVANLRWSQLRDRPPSNEHV